MNIALGLGLILGLVGQIPAAPPFVRDAAARRSYMKDAVAAYTIRRADSGSPPFRLQPEPIFRIDNPTAPIKDGAIFLWADAETGRPQAATRMFRASIGVWVQEWTSLATGPIVAEVGAVAKWQPSRPGLEIRPIPSAPAPAATPEARLRQIRALAEEFSARENVPGKGWSELRHLPDPRLRYGKPGSRVEDGALFALVLGPEPAVFLLIESRPDSASGAPRWHYAFAPLTPSEVKGSWKGKDTWSVPRQPKADNPLEPFYDLIYARELP